MVAQSCREASIGKPIAKPAYVVGYLFKPIDILGGNCEKHSEVLFSIKNVLFTCDCKPIHPDGIQRACIGSITSQHSKCAIYQLRRRDRNSAGRM
jgi:hypothetical protein